MNADTKTLNHAEVIRVCTSVMDLVSPNVDMVQKNRILGRLVKEKCPKCRHRMFREVGGKCWPANKWEEK